MKVKTIVKIPLFGLIVLLALFLSQCSAEKVKEPAVAGAFYPADGQQLAAMVDAFLAEASTVPVDGNLIALIAPHAGYEYSGRVAAYAYRHLRERTIDTVILIGSSHYAAFTGAAILGEGSMKTPLGKVKINEAVAKALIDDQGGVKFHASAFEKEHSLEVQLPFLQKTLKNFTVVPILIGQPTRETIDSLVRGLSDILARNRNAILIASSDLSHYHPDATARKLDTRATDAVARMSLENLQQGLRSGESEMCGAYSVLVTMAAARRLGATHGELYRYANSGDVMPDKSRVVGYAAMGLYQAALSEAQRQELLSLARKTIDTYVRNGTTPNYREENRRLMANGATFVTINRNGSLRGCIGNIEPMMSLYQSVVQNAVSACSRDRRFPPLSPKELKDVEVEVTVLTPLTPLVDVKDIKIGTHGLYLVKGMQSGILLPQVPVEQRWDVPLFLEQLSLKAGLPKDGWKYGQLYSFTADIIR